MNDARWPGWPFKSSDERMVPQPSDPDGGPMGAGQAAAAAPFGRAPPTRPGIFDHRNLENAKGRAVIAERVMFVGYVNWTEDPERGQGKTPMPLGSGKLRACRIEHPMTTDALTVQEWGGEWRPLDGVPTTPAAVSGEEVQP
jgi:hypothetical protein